MTRGWSCHLAVTLEVSLWRDFAEEPKRIYKYLQVAKLRLALQQLLKLGTPLQPVNFFVVTRCQWPYSCGGRV